MTEQKFIFVKLVNGDNLMCITESDIHDLKKLKHLAVSDPIQIFSFKMPYNGSIIEKYIMQAWTPFSSSTSMSIPMNNIVFVGELKQHFIDKYMEYVTDPDAQQLVEEGSQEMLDDTGELQLEDDDELGAVEEQIEELQQSIKKWYH